MRTVEEAQRAGRLTVERDDLSNMQQQQQQHIAPLEKEDGQPGAMDPQIWGHLQDHIGLAAMIYGKLPFKEFFQLCAVCKDWNQLACDRQFVADTFKKLVADDMPYFVLHSSKDAPPVAEKFLNGFLLYDETCNRWRWIRPGEALSGGSLYALLWYQSAH